MNVKEWINKYTVDCKLKYPSKATQENYISSVTSFLYYFEKEKEPKCISNDKIKNWLLSCKNENTRNHKLCAIKSFYEITLGMPIKLDKIPYSRKAQSLPMPLRFEEVELLFNNCENKKHFAIIALLFNCGLRVGEVLNLKPENIDSKGNIIHIVNGKGLKDRFVPMDDFTLNVLREYFKEYRPVKWMFNGQYSTKEKPTQYTDRSINQFLKDIAKKSGITKRIYSHLGRHSYATQLVENGTDLGMIQNVLGHKKQSTTLIYAKISSARVSKVQSPFSNIKLK
jgi:integrase/recombinase XerD